jgi:hypothetical protein
MYWSGIFSIAPFSRLASRRAARHDPALGHSTHGAICPDCFADRVPVVYGEEPSAKKEKSQPMFEHKSRPLLSRQKFYQRMARSAAMVVGIVAFSLYLGSAGYHYLASLPWIDALLNASMILAGMGPVDPVKTTAGKLFATFYALYSGITFLTMVSILMAPLLHRFLHTFHLEIEEEKKTPSSDQPNRKRKSP